ncbi:MAG: hypothetical protein HRT92_04080 [Piscirickettsiaceae bacterium]|nr:hypothetical protein [Piscirickettsiaceae bacterium]
MKDIQKYIWLLVVLALIAAVFPFLRDIYLARTYGASELPTVVKENWQAISVLVIGLQNVAAALWLRYLAKKHELGQLVWVAFGLLFGLIAVGLFYLARMNERQGT